MFVSLSLSLSIVLCLILFPPVVYVCASGCLPGLGMDILSNVGVDLELPREQLSSFLQRAYSETQLGDVRLRLFEDAKMLV